MTDPTINIPATPIAVPRLTANLTSCPKCGRASLFVRYHRSAFVDHGCASVDYQTDAAPHLHTYCSTCLFDWCVPDDTP